MAIFLTSIRFWMIIISCVIQESYGDPMWGGLYPRESSSREVRTLDGIWNFRVAPRNDPEQGFRDQWFSQQLSKTGPVMPMAVPSSYNDITQDDALRDHIGWAWYDRTFIVPQSWQANNQSVFLRLGAAHYSSIIYLNGIAIATHEGGHLPIKAEITQVAHYGRPNLLTVAINNVLSLRTIPQGITEHHNGTGGYPPNYFVQRFGFDFFNYAGIHRSVHVYTTPQTFIDDILVTTEISGSDGLINYNITVSSGLKASHEAKAIICSVDILDALDITVASASGCENIVQITNAKLWWPYLMSDDTGYMYTLQVSITDDIGKTDVYPLKIGIRTLGWNSTTLTINTVPIYITGFGKHEDSDIKGKGLDIPLLVKDFSLIKWLGANCFRTSHYPYAEEIMDMADQEGIMVIDESPAVSLSTFGDELMQTHVSVMQEMIRRDKNHPSVILWSVANEPVSIEPTAKDYFSKVVNATKTADPTRPVTAALNQNKKLEHAGRSLDIIMVNRYYSWYSDAGHLEVILNQTITEFREWHEQHSKPVLISEYGADTLAGLHRSPSLIWSEEYQAELMIENFKAFDILKSEGYFIGEMIWNFADFNTAQNLKRVGGNKKGILTRNRQPKLSAHLLRQRYLALANVAADEIAGGL